MFNQHIIKQKLTLISVMALMVLVASLTSCSTEAEPTNVTNVPEASGHYTFTMTFVTSENDADIDNQESELGTYYDNYINTSNIVLYFLADKDASGNTLAYGGNVLNALTITVNPDNVERVSDNEYTVTFDEDYTVSLPTVDFRIVAAINWPEQPVFLTYNLWMALGAATYPYNYGTTSETAYMPSMDDPLPMYGVKYYNRSDFPDDTSKAKIDFGTIHLHRAMAKVIVKSSCGIDIDGVTLTNCYDRGQNGPVVCYDDDVEELTAENINLCRDLTSSCTAANKVKNIPFKKLADNYYLLYVPEFRQNTFVAKDLSRNIAADTTSMKVAAHYYLPKYNDAGEQVSSTLIERTYTLRFQDYDTGETWDIIRNHLYLFDIIGADPFRYNVIKFDEMTAGEIEFD